MFARFYTSFFYVMSTLALLAVAMPNNPTVTVTVTAAAPTTTTVGQCDTGSIQCCNSVISASTTFLRIVTRHADETRTS